MKLSLGNGWHAPYGDVNGSDADGACDVADLLVLAACRKSKPRGLAKDFPFDDVYVRDGSACVPGRCSSVLETMPQIRLKNRRRKNRHEPKKRRCEESRLKEAYAENVASRGSPTVLLGRRAR